MIQKFSKKLCLYFSFTLVVLPCVLSTVSAAEVEVPEVLQRYRPEVNTEANPQSEEEKRWYDDSKRGWFWYEEPEPDTEEDKESQTQDPRWPDMANFTTEQLWNMHPEDFQALLKLFLQKAVQTNSVEDVKAYTKMQDIARRKSAVFANVSTYVVQQTPQFNVLAARPMNTPGKTARVRMQNDEVRNTLASSQRDFALVVFGSNGCGYCERQNRILQYFQDRHGWEIKQINTDRNPELAERFNVTVTPTILLISPHSDDYIPVSTGLITAGEIERRVTRGIAQLTGQNDPQNYSRYKYQQNGPLDYKAILKDENY
jgi:conjugal transfer pilus assembly protein TraF